MSKLTDFTGRTIGKLTVIKRIDNKGRKVMWLCKCDCGNMCKVRADNLKTGHSRSCGCSTIKHGYANKERLYETWKNMKRRCYNPNNKRYKQYGGRGIKVCDEWVNDYMNFRNWAISNGYNDSLTIDRINVNGNYEPFNCRWATMDEQQNNVTRNRILEYKGNKKTMSEWAKEYNIPYSKFNKRVQMGWDIYRIIKELGQ